MTNIPFLNYTEAPLNFEKFKKNPKKSNLKSFWAFLLTAFLYISVFYLFNLSPSTLLCSTKFWFIMSNTLILIIATDFSSFSSSTDHDYPYDVKNNVTIIPSKDHSTSVPCFEFQYVGSQEITVSSEPQNEEAEHDYEKIISIVSAHDDHTKNPETFEQENGDFFATSEKDDDDLMKRNPNENREERAIKKRRRRVLRTREVKYARSNSDRAISTAANIKEEKMVVRRTLSERHGEEVPEENEFSRMSNEELNRRVEEFIRSFNKQIRLQAAMSRQD